MTHGDDVDQVRRSLLGAADSIRRILESTGPPTSPGESAARSFLLGAAAALDAAAADVIGLVAKPPTDDLGTSEPDES